MVETIRELPWRPGSRICIGDLAWLDGSPCELSSRSVLARSLGQLTALGRSAVAAFEYELRLWDRQPDVNGKPVVWQVTHSASNAVFGLGSRSSEANA